MRNIAESCVSIRYMYDILNCQGGVFCHNTLRPEAKLPMYLCYQCGVAMIYWSTKHSDFLVSLEWRRLKQVRYIYIYIYISWLISLEKGMRGGSGSGEWMRRVVYDAYGSGPWGVGVEVGVGSSWGAIHSDYNSQEFNR